MTVRELQKKLEQLVKDQPHMADRNLAWTKQVKGVTGGVAGLGVRYGTSPTIALSGEDIPAGDYEEVEVEREWAVTIHRTYRDLQYVMATNPEGAKAEALRVCPEPIIKQDEEVMARETC